MKYFIGECGFNTKREASLFVKSRLQDIEYGKYENMSAEYKFIMDILKNHSKYEEKVGCGISYFMVLRNGKGKNINFFRSDGTIDDFSYNHCCQFKPKGYVENGIVALKNALRISVNSQIIDFKTKNKCDDCCIKCKTKYDSKTRPELDHVYPFSHIIMDFLQLTTHKTPMTFKKTFEIRYVFNDEDKQFEIDFLKYHQEHANYQYLCSNCNSKKSNHLEH
jgi:hypothetical protein